MLNGIIICSLSSYYYRNFARIIGKKIENSDKILRWKFVVRIKIDLFLHTCSDCDVSFQALLHHIDFTDIDDLWSVIC